MSDPYAPQTGSTVEGLVSAELQRLAPHYGFVAIDNVIFTRGLISVAVDHVLVDRYGLLILATEDRTGSYIIGADSDKEWTAVYTAGRTAKFANPLYLNVGNENVVRQALTDAGVTLDSTQVRSAVVFAGADLSKLTLVEVNAMKIVDVEHVVDVLEGRYNFPPNNGQLTQEDVDRIVEFVRSHAHAPEREYVPDEDVPWSQDPAVVAANRSLAAREGFARTQAPIRGDSGTMSAFTAPAELAGHLTGAGSDAPSLGTAFLTMGTIVIIVLTVAAGFAFFPQLQAGSIPAWTAAWVLLVAVAELVAANLSAVGHRGRRSLVRIVVGFLMRVVVVAAFVAGMWILVAGGGAQKFGERIAEQFAPAMQSVVTPKNQGPTPERARQVLLQRYPGAFNSADLDRPSVDKLANGRVSYTWPYTSGGGSFTLVLDSAGRFVSGKENSQ